MKRNGQNAEPHRGDARQPAGKEDRADYEEHLGQVRLLGELCSRGEDAIPELDTGRITALVEAAEGSDILSGRWLPARHRQVGPDVD